MIYKVKHKYFNKGEYPIKSIAFTIILDRKEYGYFFYLYNKRQKYKKLKDLILIKHELIKNNKYINSIE